VLNDQTANSPAKIGEAVRNVLGVQIYDDSRWSWTRLNTLRNNGLVERFQHGRYRLTPAGAAKAASLAVQLAHFSEAVY